MTRKVLLKLLAERFGLKKPHPNTHLWFGDEPIADFPGHKFRIVEVVPYASKNIKRFAALYPRASLSTRNFDTSSDALRSKLKIKDGPLRLFAITAFQGEKLLVVCE